MLPPFLFRIPLGLPHAHHSDSHMHTFSFTAQPGLPSTFLDVNYFSMKNDFLPCKFICMFFSPPELGQGSPGKGKHLPPGSQLLEQDLAHSRIPKLSCCLREWRVIHKVLGPAPGIP